MPRRVAGPPVLRSSLTVCAVAYLPVPPSLSVDGPVFSRAAGGGAVLPAADSVGCGALPADSSDFVCGTGSCGEVTGPDPASTGAGVAVFGGGSDGTQTIMRFLAQAPAYLKPGGSLVMATAHSQGRVVAGAARSAFPGASVEVLKDLAGYERLVVVRTR